MPLIDDHQPQGAKSLFHSLHGQHYMKGFRRGDEDVRHFFALVRFLLARHIPGPNTDLPVQSHARHHALSAVLDFLGQRADGSDPNELKPLGLVTSVCAPDPFSDGSAQPGVSFARTGWRLDQHLLSLAVRIPGIPLKVMR